ncbi:uncharacterized protein ACHE_50896S [Aspergillus chevalieri]|uniref:Uncharacterized protein n=1 Tax=Aspergillus chevalieri TaxID=182096 RepID=A0A7R7VRX2_ASPCH|nr:uncharacterized protein ACHE_50896S [Aspergillus chevalieri]BCR89698.1 hypothetical protein ACHE_50896S [Aspergillus chevalieri]
MAAQLLDNIPTMTVGSVAVVKAFDHWFARQLREDWRLHYQTLSAEREREFRAFAREDGIEKYLARLDSDGDDEFNYEDDKEGEDEHEDSNFEGDYEESDQEVSPGKGEAFFYHLMRKW